jgi:hypothetical protein
LRLELADALAYRAAGHAKLADEIGFDERLAADEAALRDEFAKA